MMLDHDAGTIPRCGKYANLRGKRILVVEDEAVVAVDYYFQLRAVGAEPKAYASTIKNSLDILAARDDIDAAIVGFELRDGSCEPVLELLVAQRIPFVVVSGFTDVVHSHLVEPEMVLSKPVDPDELYRSLSDALGGASPRDYPRIVRKGPETSPLYPVDHTVLRISSLQSAPAGPHHS